jgi:DEAD/DEAH box helicase domain-containing protein
LKYQRQQAGRAGRRTRDALVVLVVDNNSLDQHYLLHPDELFSSPTESLDVELNSPVILEAHLQCASQEMPLNLEDESYFGPLFRQICETKLVKDAHGWYDNSFLLVVILESLRFHPNPRYLPYPSQHIAIRGIQEEHYMVLEVPPPFNGIWNVGSGGRILEEIEFSRALFEVSSFIDSVTTDLIVSRFMKGVL